MAYKTLAAACLLLILSAGCAGPAAPTETTGADAVGSLFEAVQPTNRNAPPEIEALLSGRRATAQDDPSWPTVTYLRGEVERQRGNVEPARAAFRELASWAASDPYGDTWGGSGLAIVGLWRWLQILDERGPASAGEVDLALELAEQLRETRLASGMLQSGLLPGLPLVAEDLAHRLMHVAWKHQRQELAFDLYLDFLAIDSRGEIDDVDRQVQAQLLEKGLATRDRLDFFRARRQLALVKTEAQKDEAARTLKKLWDDRQAPVDVRTEAGYEWANYQRQKRGTPELVEVLSEVIALAGSGPVAVKALYRRGIIQGGEALIADMADLRRRFPKSPMEDEALYQLATAYLFRPDLDKALAYYGELRDYQGLNDYQDSAWYLPALGLVGRNRDGDLEAADRLLADYLIRHSDGVYRVRSLFWRGRIAERKNDAERAKGFFRQVIGETPYGYYGLRARLHLDEGIKAISQDLPAADSQTRAALGQAYRNSRVDTELTAVSPYHRRLEAAASPGFYERLLAAEFDTQKALGKRLDDIPLDVLDARGLIPAATQLLALRQDALAARDFDVTADNWLRLAGLLGTKLQDWPAAGEITIVSAAAPRERLTALQADARYLVTVYPHPAQLPRLELQASLARAAWPMGGSKPRSQSVMYALIHQESRFYAGAISPVGAVGLLQLMPATFAKLDEQSQLLQASGAASDVEYLLDPQNNIATAAGWWKTELGKDELPVAVMKHNAGIRNVSKWAAYWAQIGCEDDLEYRVETVRFRETGNFLRGVLLDTAITEAAGFFDEPHQYAEGGRP
ncbi:MAG: soluble lytic murein transglycosylase [Acidobacteriota bacterium]|jgi:soluble lytic murein transglycosylase-like protein|nr:soluble lytic murein transglycosylase [Acidobacteriota bacterium]